MSYGNFIKPIDIGTELRDRLKMINLSEKMRLASFAALTRLHSYSIDRSTILQLPHFN